MKNVHPQRTYCWPTSPCLIRDSLSCNRFPKKSSFPSFFHFPISQQKGNIPYFSASFFFLKFKIQAIQISCLNLPGKSLLVNPSVKVLQSFSYTKLTCPFKPSRLFHGMSLNVHLSIS